MNDSPTKLIRNWRFKTSRQHRLEIPCSVPLWERLRFYRDHERPVILAASSGTGSGQDSGRVSHYILHLVSWTTCIGVDNCELLRRLFSCLNVQLSAS